MQYTELDPSDFEPIEFDNTLNQRIRVKPMYYESGFSENPKIFGRKIILNKLINALEILPQKYGFLIWDVYRPRAVQSKLFNWMRNEVRKRSPSLNDEENYKETCKYMSPPSIVGESYCPPHLSGGAIDLTLFEVEKGNELEMGTIFDDCTELAHSEYFEKKDNLNAMEKIYRSNRKLLKSTMNEVGFLSYEYEWWHFDFGDIFWSRRTGSPQLFGALFGDNEF